MNPLRLELRNCRTFQEIDLDLPEGLLAILGSNGAGKSTLINAIDVALFGLRNLGDWYPRESNGEPLTITLTFEHEGATYRVRRSYSPKGRGQTKTDLERSANPVDGWSFVQGEHVWEPLTVESQGATNEQIENLIGLSRDTFRASVFLAQGEAGFFCEAQPRARKQILADVLGLGQWDGWLERAKLEKKVAQSALDKIAGALEQAEIELAERDSLVTERSEVIVERDAAAVDLWETTQALTTAREALIEQEKQGERRANAEKAVQDAEAQLSDLKVAISAREEEIRIIEVRLADREVLATLAEALPGIAEEQEAHRVAVSQWQERERLEKQIAGLVAQSEHADGQAKDYEKEAIVVLSTAGELHCDRCGQILNEEASARAAKSFRKDAFDAWEQAARANEEAKLLTAVLTEMPTEQPDKQRSVELNRLFLEAQGANARLAALDEAAKRKFNAEEEVFEMRAGLPGREEDMAVSRAQLEALGPHDPRHIDEAKDEVAKHLKAETIARKTIDGFNVAIARKDEQLERLAKIAAGVEESAARRDELHTEMDLLSSLEKACGPNGVPALTLETVAIPQIEVEASRILGRLGGPAYAVELRTLREKKAGGLSDTLDIVLLTETGEAPYEAFSGGERARVAFALRLALAQLLASRKGSATGLLVIDELEGLDAQGIAQLVSVLDDLQRSIPRILVVSHVAEMRDSFENTLLLEQVDGVSRVVDDLPLEVVA